MANPNVQSEIQKITDQLIRAYHPQKIVLFGSAAGDDPSQAHDLDFFIIKDQVPKTHRERAREVRQLINKGVAADFMILTTREAEERARLGDPFVQHILTRGKALYG